MSFVIASLTSLGTLVQSIKTSPYSLLVHDIIALASLNALLNSAPDFAVPAICDKIGPVN